MKLVYVNGVAIDLDSDQAKGFKTADDIKKSGLFEHFNEGAKKSSEEQLLNLVQGKNADGSKVGSEPAQAAAPSAAQVGTIGVDANIALVPDANAKAPAVPATAKAPKP